MSSAAADLPTEEFERPSAEELLHHPVEVAKHWTETLTEHALQLVRFSLVGGFGYLVNLSCFSVLHISLKVDYLLAAALAFVFSVCGNYLLNRHWTFRDRQGRLVTQGMLSVILAFCTFIVSIIILHLLVKQVHLATVLAQALAVGICLPLNFLLQRFWVFRTKT